MTPTERRELAYCGLHWKGDSLPEHFNEHCVDCRERLSLIERVLAEGEPANDLTFARFSTINLQRCESAEGFNHKLDSWSLSDWFTAALGEFGEAANYAKKLNRVRDGIPGNKETADALRDKLRKEIGDTGVYLDLLAQRAGFNLSAAMVEVFNAKSEELGCKIKIEKAAPLPAGTTTELSKRIERGMKWGQILGPDYDGVSVEDVLREFVQLKAAAPQGWQPIESAPKDRTSILGFTPYDFVRVGDVFYNPDMEEWQRLPGDHARPTHWMPLPECPKP